MQITTSPHKLRSYRSAAHVVTKIPANFKKGLEYLGPEIEKRLENLRRYGDDYPDKPVSAVPPQLLRSTVLIYFQFDFLSWLIDTAVGEEKTAVNLSRRILMLDLAAIHTSTIVSLQDIVSSWLSHSDALFYPLPELHPCALPCSSPPRVCGYPSSGSRGGYQ